MRSGSSSRRGSRGGSSPCVGVGAFLVPAYNLELLGGRLHTDLWFALAWGAFPVVTAYVAMTGRVRGEAIAGAAAATILSLAQRRLSRHVRDLRRRTTAVRGELVRPDGSVEPLTAEALLVLPEATLALLSAATVLAALALAVSRL